MVEQTFAVAIENRDERLKPDIVAVKYGSLNITDISVQFEDGRSLEEAHNEKVIKYTPSLPRLLDVFKCKTGKVLPLIIGARGALSKESVRSMKTLDILTPGVALTTSMIALQSSLELALRHIDN